MRVNLLDEGQRGPEISWKEVFLALGVAILVMLLAGHYMLITFQLGQLEEQLGSEKKQLDTLQEREERYHELRQEISGFTIPEEYRIRQPRIGKAFKYLSSEMPLTLAMEQVRFEDSEIVFSGYTSDVWPLLSLMLSLRESEYYKQVTVEHFRRDGEVYFHITARLPGRGEG